MILNSDSFTLSVVGRVPSPGIAFNGMLLRLPATILRVDPPFQMDRYLVN